MAKFQKKKKSKRANTEVVKGRAQDLYRILKLAADQLKLFGAFYEKTAAAFFDAIIETALQCVACKRTIWRSFKPIPKVELLPYVSES